MGVILCMLNAQKMVIRTSRNAGRELSVLLFDSLVSLFVAKTSSISFRVDWCVNYSLQSNQFGLFKKKKKKMEKIEV